MALMRGLNPDHLKGDLYGGLVAAVVALPLALAFGVASGAGAAAGLYGAICVGLFAALFGGTPAQVSGPTGPMTVVMAGIFAQLGQEPALAFTAVILGGGLQILLGASGVGRYITLVPYPVISGFMSGIGCIIIILQLGPLIGHAAEPGGLWPTIQAIPGYVLQTHFDAAILGVTALLIVGFTPERIGRLVPPPLIALMLLTPLAALALPDAPVIGSIPRGLPLPIIPELHFDAVKLVIGEAVVLALLGSIDSLLTSLVCDNMTRMPHDSNRELIGQGIGNMVAGCFGGLPGAGATMRSVANIRTGGRTPVSGAFHAVILLAILLGLGPLAEAIPLAVLAGILFKVGVDIIDWRFLKHLVGTPKAEVVIMLLVLLTTVLADLITAVGVGVVAASLLFVKRMADMELASMHIITGHQPETPLSSEEAEILAQHTGRIILIHIDGPMSFGSAKNMVRRLEGVRSWGNFQTVVLDLSDVPTVDGTSALAIEDIIRMTTAHKQQVLLVGLRPSVVEVLEGVGVLSLIPPRHRFSRRLDALQHAARETGLPDANQHPPVIDGHPYLYLQESRPTHHGSQAVIVRCFDDRFWQTSKGFLHFYGIQRFEGITVAGGAKAFSSAEPTQEFGFMLAELKNVINTSRATRCLLFTHHDCGAYGGFSRWNEDREKELAFHRGEHERILANLRQEFPSLKTEIFFIDLSGVMKIV